MSQDNLDAVMPAGDERILVLFTARGRGKGSNVEVKAQWAHVWKFRAGKATRVEGFIDQSEALKVAGLRAFPVLASPGSGRFS
jgi:ketosteroid isomerase-like protein